MTMEGMKAPMGMERPAMVAANLDARPSQRVRRVRRVRTGTLGISGQGW